MRSPAEWHYKSVRAIDSSARSSSSVSLNYSPFPSLPVSLSPLCLCLPLDSVAVPHCAPRSLSLILDLLPAAASLTYAVHVA
eukprot:795356-Rhodomonas_salina.2